MSRIQSFLGEWGAQFAGAAYSARQTAGFVQDFGPWGSCLYNGQYFDARGNWPNTDFQFGESRIDITPGGWLNFVLNDRLGWKPFLVLFGAEPGRQVRAGVTFSVAMPDDYPGFSIIMPWDPTRGSYEVIGPTSDGSSDAAGRPMVIQIQPADDRPLTFSQAAVGWTQLETFTREA